MNKPNVSKIFKTIQTVVSTHSPEILTGIGIAGMITTTVLAVKATPEALKCIDEKKREVYDELDPLEVPGQATPEDLNLKPMEIIKASWKCYIPAAITCTASVACLVGASKINFRRNAALATAYNLSQTALTEYKEQVVQAVGEEKEREIQKKADEKIVEKQSSSESTIFLAGGQKYDCIDAMSNQKFKSDITSIREAVVRLNNRLRDEMTVSLNDYYDELNIERMPSGEALGWYVNKCQQIETSFNTMLIDGIPYIVVDFILRPDYDYNDYR